MSATVTTTSTPTTVDNEDNEDENDEYIVVASCTIEAIDSEGSFDEEQIAACSACWQEAGDSLGVAGSSLAEACVELFMPTIQTYCQGEVVFPCFLDYVKEHDKDGLVQARVAQYLESVQEEFVIIASCTIEAMAEDGGFDEAAIKECSDCWPWSPSSSMIPSSLSAEGLSRAKECVAQHLPRVGAACQGYTDLLAPEDME
jgi:hypothetical protein